MAKQTISITLNVTPRQVEVVGHLLRVATEELERRPATRKSNSISLTDIAEARRLKRKLTRAFLKTIKHPGTA